MRLFTSKGVHLANIGLPAKLVYTFFLGLVALGVWSSWAIYAERLSGPDGPAIRYLDAPNDAAASAELPTDAGGPAVDLPVFSGREQEREQEQDAAALTKWPWILDVFHQHVFSVSVVFLILAHLFMLTRLRPWIASIAVAATGLATLLHLLAPLIIHLSGSWLWLMGASGAAMGLTWVAMMLWTLAAMWLRIGAEPARAV